jgi:c-di-GMP-binding flagellar brake protein YcgR
MSRNGQPATQDRDAEQFLVRSRQDILPILQAVASHQVPVRVRFADRPDAVDTRLLSVKPHYEELLFDAAGMGNLVFVEGQVTLSAAATYDYIHVSFHADHVEAAVFRGKPAFRARIPSAVSRSQRRGSMRFPVPSGNPPVVRLRLAGRGAESRMRVMDISYGGVCLVLEDKRVDIAAGARLAGCKLELPRLGVVETDLEVAYTDLIDPQSGWRRLGCRFSGLSLLALDRVRDYVTGLEREHLAAVKTG